MICKAPCGLKCNHAQKERKTASMRARSCCWEACKSFSIIGVYWSELPDLNHFVPQASKVDHTQAETSISASWAAFLQPRMPLRGHRCLAEGSEDNDMLVLRR